MDPLTYLEVTTKGGRVVRIAPDDISTNHQTGLVHMWDSLLCEYNDNRYDLFEDLKEANCEIKSFLLNSENNSELTFHGIILEPYNVKEVQFKPGEHTHNQIKNDANPRMVLFIARGFSALLGSYIISDREIEYKNGYGEAIKKLVEPLGVFDLDRIVEDPSMSGSIYFENVTLLEAFRRLAYIRRWCLKFRGKSIIFEPCLESQEVFPSPKTYSDIVNEVTLKREPVFVE